jgi:hypothetical protein
MDFDSFEWFDPVTVWVASCVTVTLVGLFWVLDWATRDLKKW